MNKFVTRCYCTGRLSELQTGCATSLSSHTPMAMNCAHTDAMLHGGVYPMDNGQWSIQHGTVPSYQSSQYRLTQSVEVRTMPPLRMNKTWASSSRTRRGGLTATHATSLHVQSPAPLRGCQWGVQPSPRAMRYGSRWRRAVHASPARAKERRPRLGGRHADSTSCRTRRGAIALRYRWTVSPDGLARPPIRVTCRRRRP